jgi:hypothetical protein
MLQTIATKYKYASIETFEKLSILFIHTKGNLLQLTNRYIVLKQILLVNSCQLWVIQFVNGVFLFRRVSKSELYLDFDYKSRTIINIMDFSNIVKVITL